VKSITYFSITNIILTTTTVNTTILIVTDTAIVQFWSHAGSETKKINIIVYMHNRMTFDQQT